MSWAVTNIAGSIAGTQQAARAATRDVERKEPAKARRARDEFDQTAEATGVEHAEAVRSLKDNTQEEAHEDRQQHGERPAPGHEQASHADDAPTYTARPAERRPRGPQPSRLNVEG